MAAKALLLIALSLDARDAEYFELPVVRGAAWYGLSPATVSKGLSELQSTGLLRTWTERRESERSAVGFTYDRRHRLNPIDVVGGRRLFHANG